MMLFQFKIYVETPKDTKQYKLFLDRKKIPYPVVLTDCWELSYEEKPNQLKVEALSKADVSDMKEMIRRIGYMMDRILNS